MSKTCIICGSRAGSGEHVFPAVLGGRRVNNGIYCEAHNNGFSPLAAVIGDQLRMINALLAVRPDRKNAAQPHRYTSPDGESLVIFNGVVEREVRAPDYHKRLHVEQSFGGPEGLRAVAYIALTFFAAYFQEHARKPELQAVKDFLLGNGDNEFVWWDVAPAAGQLSENPFAFGHTVALTTSATTGRATAYLSFFGALSFGLDFGALPDLADRSVVLFIDPQAEKAPEDLKKEEHSVALLQLRKPDPLHAHLERIIFDGIGQQVLQGLLQRIEEWKFAKEMAPILTQLNGLRSEPEDVRREEIAKIVKQEISRIYRIMRYIANDFSEKQATSLAAVLIPIMQRTIKTSQPPAATFNADGEFVILTSAAKFVAELDNELAKNEIGMDYLWALFSGGRGAGFVGEIMFARVSDLG